MRETMRHTAHGTYKRKSMEKTMANDLCMLSNLSIDDIYHDSIYIKIDTTIETIFSSLCFFYSLLPTIYTKL